MAEGLSRELIALKVARELRDGMVVNLGIGLPTLVSNFLPPGAEIFLQAEDGILGYGPISDEDFDPDLINAGGQPVTLLPGASFFDSAASFAMIRGGHVDVAVLGGMDLACGAKRLIVAMTHTAPGGRPRIRKACEYPLTATGVVDLIVTDLAVIEVHPEGLLLTEVAPGVDPDEVQSRTEPTLRRSPGLREMEL
jgi:3-oxoacid CoA-transferase subunit B